MARNRGTTDGSLHAAVPVERRDAGPLRSWERMSKKTVLFVCIGNACRSQMAEAFARATVPMFWMSRAAGLAPAVSIPELTIRVMLEKNLRMEGQYPKPLDTWAGTVFDLAINTWSPLPPGVASR